MKQAELNILIKNGVDPNSAFKIIFIKEPEGKGYTVEYQRKRCQTESAIIDNYNIETQRGGVKYFASLDTAKKWAESKGFKSFEVWL